MLYFRRIAFVEKNRRVDVSIASVEYVCDGDLEFGSDLIDLL